MARIWERELWNKNMENLRGSEAEDCGALVGGLPYRWSGDQFWSSSGEGAGISLWVSSHPRYSPDKTPGLSQALPSCPHPMTHLSLPSASLHPLSLPGLLMFAVTHMLYASAFGMRPLALRTGLVMAVLSCLAYALLYPCLSDAFTYLVGVYVALIGFMGWRAMAGLRLVGAAWRWTELAAGSGAVLFIISDLTIALNKFCFLVPYSRALIMSTYYAAQMLIALSAVESREPMEDYRLSKAN